MTTIITRLYPDVATAQAVAAALASKGLEASDIDIITRDGSASAEAHIRKARVPADSAAAYDRHMTGGRALLVVRAPFAPMGTALRAMRVVNGTPALDAGVEDENVYIREQPRVGSSGTVLHGTVFFMSNPHRSMHHGHVLSRDPILRGRTPHSAIPGGGHMSTKFWPMKLISEPKERSSAIRGGFLFSSLLGLPTIIRDWGPREIMTKI